MTQEKQIRPAPIEYRPIGIIHSPYTTISDMPIQPAGADAIRGTVELFSEYAAGISDLDGFSHIILLYHFHRAGPGTLTVIPFLDTVGRGVFATRAPTRPNAIGLSTLRLVSVEGPLITVEGIDILDGTPLLDLKPYIPEFDAVASTKHGWIDTVRKHARSRRSDSRFS
ncbi:tRNA (N6-threonylcarbamoyladenosine(37)-N6)-methyltransferase TrmO [bacterium]|nr:tRNA (N6-threonylcarbamoyladenosine(37)-N6)-methyltransferase TrmO [bacterium]